MDFSDNFNRICRERGTTPTAVVKEMGLSPSKVTMWNNGSLPKQPVLVQLARHLNCYVMDFFAEDEMPKVEFAMDEDERDVLRLFRTLSRKEKHEFMSRAYDYEKKKLKEGENDV